MIDAAGIPAEIAAAMHREDFQLRVPLQHAVEDQVMQRDRGLQRIADDVIEIEPLKPLCLGEAVGMQHHQHAELLSLFPERREGRIRQFLAGDVGQDLHAGEAELFDAALQLLRRLVAVGHRHRAEAFETVGIFVQNAAMPSLTICAAFTAMSSGTV